ncbi:MAG: DeoR family transcriptional regulator [Bacteroidetes bacterium]|nr:DeoR family transcriptional regulator [Bacteroidota bacterium]
MSYQNRKHKIVNFVEEKGEASVKELSDHTNASEATIRRDLIQMAEAGLIFRTHGGAMKLSLVNPTFTFAQKAARNLDKKDYLCSLAAKEINDGDTIFMDCGSTVFSLCPFLKNKQIKIITNSLPVIYELTGTKVSINLIGGEFDTERQAAHGSMAVEHIRRYHADKAFIGTDGFSVEEGLSANSEREAEISLAMIDRAKTVYLLCDSAKINKKAYFQFATLKQVDTLVTDAKNNEIKALKKISIRILNH